MTLEVADRTDIITPEQISFCNSPIHLRIQNNAKDSSITRVILYLWIWNEEQNKVLGNANFTLKKDYISVSDDYINFQVADLIKSVLIGNNNQPYFAYNQVSDPTITGQGVFWQAKAEVYSGGTLETWNSGSYFATLGYKFNYEQNQTGFNGFGGTVNRWYNPLIHNYISQNFNLTTTVATGTTTNLINITDITPPNGWKRCTKDPSLIVFLNKNGLWEMFTPHGKITTKSKIDSETSNLGFRDPSKIDNTYTHSKLRYNLDVAQSYIINTGLLDETMVSIVEQILLSPKVYLIKFKGDIITAPQVGITIDNTYVTIDDTTITIDSDTIGLDDAGFFYTHQQIPVTVTNSDFDFKNRINDKNSIEYNIELEETNNKILDIR